jgi:hypothetical protein
MTAEVKSMFKELLEGLKSPTGPMQVVNPTASESEANSGKEAAKGIQYSPPLGKNGMGIHASVGPPPDYGGPVPSPRINPLGAPPKLDLNNFHDCVFRIKSHLNHSSTQLWRVIEQGFHPHDRYNMTPREKVDNQLNHSALFILQSAMPPKELSHLRPFTTSKDAWDHIVSLYKGSSIIQRSNFEVILDEADEFVMNEDEDPHDLYRRLKALAVSLRDHGNKDMDDTWVKHKFLKAIKHYNNISSVIR